MAALTKRRARTGAERTELERLADPDPPGDRPGTEGRPPGGSGQAGLRAPGSVFGAFRPATGEARTHPYPGRTTTNWIDFLDRGERWVPAQAGAVDAVLDNLPAHRGAGARLFSRADPRWAFVFPPVAVHRNVIEPWWKVLRSLAPKGWRFESWQPIGGGETRDGVLERPPAPVRLGTPSSPPAPANTRRCHRASHPVTWRMRHF